MSLCALLASMMSGCLIEDPPPYRQPQQTTPWLDLRLAVPFIDQVLVRDLGQTVAFSVPFRSEDAGEGLVAYLVLDLAGDGNDAKRQVAIVEVPPSTLDDPDRDPLTFEWTITEQDVAKEGCHRLTLLVTHQSNISRNLVVDNPNDLSTAVWWANIGTDPLDSGMLQNCPDATTRVE